MVKFNEELLKSRVMLAGVRAPTQRNGGALEVLDI